MAHYVMGDIHPKFSQNYPTLLKKFKNQADFAQIGKNCLIFYCMCDIIRLYITRKKGLRWRWIEMYRWSFPSTG